MGCNKEILITTSEYLNYSCISTKIYLSGKLGSFQWNVPKLFRDWKPGIEPSYNGSNKMKLIFIQSITRFGSRHYFGNLDFKSSVGHGIGYRIC